MQTRFGNLQQTVASISEQQFQNTKYYLEKDSSDPYPQYYDCTPPPKKAYLKGWQGVEGGQSHSLIKVHMVVFRYI